MLKDYSQDPMASSESQSSIAIPTHKRAHESTNGDFTYQNSKIHADSNSSAFKTESVDASPLPGKSAKTPRSSHKVVTPLRRQSTSFLVASLESLFSDSQKVSDQIAKFSDSAANSFKSPATRLTNSFSHLSTGDILSDPSLLQSHVQKSLENSSTALAFESASSPYKMSAAKNCNSLYNTPIRCKQSRSHDFSELPSQQRMRNRRSSIVVHEDEDLLTLFGGPLSDLSHFKDSADDEIEVIDVITPSTFPPSLMSEPLASFEFDQISDNSQTTNQKNEELENTDKVNAKRCKATPSRSYSLPSTVEFQDGSKPSFSYASLIAQSIIASPRQRLALSNIYSWIMDTYPYYQAQTCGWQNSIRHNLSLNKCFKKYPRDDDEPGKGAYWTIDHDEMDDFEDGMFKRRRSSSSNTSNSNSTCASQANSVNVTPKAKPISCCNNAFVNGTGWSPLMSSRTPNTKARFSDFRTPQVAKANESFYSTASVPMTPLTMSGSSVNQFETPKKTADKVINAILTPKLVCNSATRSPYSSAYSAFSQPAFKASPTASAAKTSQTTVSDGSKATFWSYPNMPLSQMGLDGEPPEFCVGINSLSFTEEEAEKGARNDNNNMNINMNMDNFNTHNYNNNKIPELFQSSNILSYPINSSSLEKDNGGAMPLTRMSPLSWLLSVSSQDSSLGLFDQSQQILSDYLSLNM